MALVALLVLGFAPLLAAFLLRTIAVEGEFESTNRGLLLQPPLQIADLVDDHAARAGRWQVILVGSPCDGACAEAEVRLRALPTLLGRDSTRVMISRLAPPVSAALSPTVQVGVYIADPLGNVILYYRYPQAGGELLMDLKHLLKFSSMG